MHRARRHRAVRERDRHRAAAEAGGLTLKKQYKYGRVLLWKYTKPMQNTDPAENEPKGEAL